MATLDSINEGNEMTFDTVVVKEASGNGIKVDITTPTFPWRDITGSLSIHEPGGGGGDPTYDDYIGNIKAYKFDTLDTTGSNGDEMFVEFHLPHDYAEGTNLYIHAHWGHNSGSVTTGAVTWDFQASYAKGHNQAAFSAPITAQASQDASTTQYQHMIAEVQLSDPSPSATQLDTDDIEIDGLILVRVSLSANSMDGSADPFLHQVDIHYQSTNVGTKDKAPDFYT